MDAEAIELARKVAEFFTSTTAGYVVSKGLDRVQESLTERFPMFKGMLDFQRGQVERSLDLLNARVSTIERIVDDERVLGFVNMCFRYFEAGAKEHRDFKLKMLAAVCAGTADADNTDPYDISLDMWDAVEAMQPFDVRVLRWVRTNAQRIDNDADPVFGRFNLSVCSFDEIAQAKWDRPQPKGLWLAKSILRLNTLNVLTVEGGSMATIQRGGGTYGPVHATNDEPLFKVQRADIGLSAFGEKVLQRLEQVIEGD